MRVARSGRIYMLRGPFGRRTVLAFGALRSNSADPLPAISEVDERLGTTTQVFDASAIAGHAHLVCGAFSALTSWSEGWNFTESLKLELICHTASDRQITRAIGKVGVKPGVRKLAFLVIGSSRENVRAAAREISSALGLRRDDGVLDIGPEKLKRLARLYSISNAELRCSSIEDLIFERISLLGLG